MSRPSSKGKREVIYEPLAPLPQQAKFPRRRKTVNGLGLAPPLPGLVKRQSSLTQIGWIAATPPSNDKRGGGGEAEEGEEGDGDGEEDGEYIYTNRGAKAKRKTRGGSGSGSGSARRSSKKVLEKTDSQPTFTQAVRHISKFSSSDVESTSSAEEEEELPQQLAKAASTSTKAKPNPKLRTASKKLEKTDSQPTFTQALRTAPVQRTKRPAQGFEIWHDPSNHDQEQDMDTPMERVAKRRKMRGGMPEVMDLVALHDSRYAHNLGHGVKGESESESPEIAESSQVLGMDSDAAVVLGKAQSVRKLRSRDVVSPARPAEREEEGRRYPSLRLRKGGRAVVERSPLKNRDANVRSPVKKSRKEAKGKAGGKVQTVAGEESQFLAQQMLGVMGTQVVPSSAVIKHDSEEDDEGEEREQSVIESSTKRSLRRKTTIPDSSEGSDTESEVEDMEHDLPKSALRKAEGITAIIAESQAEDDGDAEEAEAGEDEDENNDEDESPDADMVVEEQSVPHPKALTSPRKLKRVHTVQESQVEDFELQDEEWNDWDDEMSRATLSKNSILLPEPQAQVPSLKRKASVLELQPRDSGLRDEQQHDDQTIVQDDAGEEEGLEQIEIWRDGMPPPQPQARPSKLQRVGTVQESQPSDSDFDTLDEEDIRDDDATTVNSAREHHSGAEDEEVGMPPPPFAPQQGRGPRKLKRVATVQDSQVEDFGEDLEMEWVAPLTIDEAPVSEEDGVNADHGEGSVAVVVEEDRAVMSEDVVNENEEAVTIEEEETIAVERDGDLAGEVSEAAVLEGDGFVDIDVLLADQERTLASDRGVGGEGVEGGVQANKPNELRRRGDEVLQTTSQLGADDLDAGRLRADLYEKSPALVDAVQDVAELGPRHDGSSLTARNEPAEATDNGWYSTARERSSQRPASQLAESGNDGDAVEPSQGLGVNNDGPSGSVGNVRLGDVEVIDLQDEDTDANSALSGHPGPPAMRPWKSVEPDDAKNDSMPPPTNAHGEQTSKPVEIIELMSDNEDDENYEDELTPGPESITNDDSEDYYEGTYDPASAALDRDAARFAQRTQTQGWKQTQVSVYSHDLDEPAPVVKYRPFMTPGKIYKKTFDEPVEQKEEEWEDDEAGMQLEAELGEAAGGVVVSSQAAERVKGGGIVVRDSQKAEVDVSCTGGAARDVLADEERVPSSPPALTFTKPALPELQPVLPAGDERVPSSPPPIRPSQVSTVGPTQLSSIRPRSRNGPSTETQWSLHSPHKFTQPRWQHQEETLSSSPLAIPPWSSPERRRFVDMGMGKSKGKQAAMGSMGGYSLGELEDFSLPPPPPISSSRAGTQSGRSSSPVVKR
ncbi:hypothetical protein LTR17_020711 [Elasticomyces elasticus]|nr:hypothetical protein LTR17_020711 [Elasticomyces elasticus]